MTRSCTGRWIALFITSTVACTFSDSAVNAEQFDSIRLYPVLRGGKWGCIDRDGNEVVPIQYAWANTAAAGAAVVRTDDTREHLVDAEGRRHLTADAIQHIGESLYSVRHAERFRVYKFHEGRYLSGEYAGVGLLGNNLVPVSDISGRWGYIDAEGNVVVPFNFERALEFVGDRAPVRVGGKWGYIDLAGNVAIEPLYAMALPFAEGFACVGIRVGDALRMQYLDLNGRSAFAQSFRWASQFSEGLAAVFDDDYGLFGFIGADGKYAIPPRFRAARSFSNGLAPVVLDGNQAGYIDKTGEFAIRIPSPVVSVYSLGDFVDDLALMKADPCSYEEGWTYINRDGHRVWDAREGKVGDPRWPLLIRAWTGETWWRNGKFGFVTVEGDVAIPFRYALATHFTGAYAVVAPEANSSQFNLIDGNGNVLWRDPHIFILSGSLVATGGHEQVRLGNLCRQQFDRGRGYSMVLPFLGQERLVVMQHARWGFVDVNGNTVIHPQYTAARPFSEGRAAVRVADKWGFIDLHGKMVIEPSYGWVEDQVMGAYSYGYARVRAESSNYFYIDRAGRRAFGREFPEAGRFSEGLAVVKDPDTGLYGYLDTDGAYVIPPALAEASDFSEGRAAVRMQDGKWAYIDRRGDISTVFPATDHSPVLTAYSSGYAIVVLGPGRSGVIDRSGGWIWKSVAAQQ